MDWAVERRAILEKALASSASLDVDMAPAIVPKRRLPREDRASRLRQEGVDPFLAKLLAARGIDDVSQIGAFPDPVRLTGTLKNCREMAVILANCIDHSLSVLILADYDCDGATACAILETAFRAAGLKSEYLIPDRRRDGYGLTVGIVDSEIAPREVKPDYIITVDNGISSHDGVRRSRELGIEVLVTDHHTPADTLPDAALIVNPNQPGCEFGSKSVAGCGVAWYVALALSEELLSRGKDPGFDAADLLPFVAIGTIADVVCLDRNNRALVSEGMRRIRDGRCSAGIKALVDVAGGALGRLTCTDVAFALGPRLNAAGRLENMTLGVELLLCGDPAAALLMASELDGINRERQRITREMELQAEQAVAEMYARLDPAGIDTKVLTVFYPDWHEGVVGIVAGRLKELHHRPCFVLCQAADGTVKGSGRSISALHLKHALDTIAASAPGVFLRFGGHGMAAGVTIDPAQVSEFGRALEEVCGKLLSPEDLLPVVWHDGSMEEDHLTIDAIKMLGREVWGSGFESPVFADTWDVLGAKAVGKEKRHLKLILGRGSLVVDAIAFGASGLMGRLPPKIDCLYEIQLPNYNGNESVQLVINHFFAPGVITASDPGSTSKTTRGRSRKSVPADSVAARHLA